MRILTGIQASGKPHLGNILGAIIPAVELSKQPGNDSFLFIADLHTLTSLKDGESIRNNTLSIAAAWLAFGFDTEKNYIYPKVFDINMTVTILNEQLVRTQATGILNERYFYQYITDFHD